MKTATSLTAPVVSSLILLSLIITAPCLSAPPGNVRGAEASADIRQEPAKQKASLNPVGWLLRPVTQLQAQSLRLEEKIVNLTGPITALPPAMVGLEDKMVGVQNQIGVVGREMGSMKADIADMRTHLVELQKPITDLRDPIVRLQKPLSQLEQPLANVSERLDRQLDDLKTILSLVLTSIFVAAALVAVGTPAAAIFIWRNRKVLLPASDNNRGALRGGPDSGSTSSQDREPALSGKR